MVTRIMVVDDHVLVRQGIVKLLSNYKDIEVVGEASDGFEGISKANELQPDIVLMDRYMPGLDGIEATRLLRRDLPEVNVILLTASINESDILTAMQAGARGYIPKSADIATLIKQIRQVQQGGVALSEEVTARLIASLSQGGPSEGRNANVPVPLTAREKDVLQLVSKGMTNKEIAQALFVSENTIRAHVRSLMQKLNMDNRTQLAVYGIRDGMSHEEREAS